MIKKIFMFALSVFILFACDKINDDIVDPEISSVKVSSISGPDSVVFSDTVKSFTTSLKFDDSKSIQNVWCKVFSIDGSFVIEDVITLEDNGDLSNGDKTADDNEYTAKVLLSQDFPYSFYDIEYFVKYINQQTQKVAVHNFHYDNAQFNIPPEILSVSVPDSITIFDEVVQFIIEAEIIDSNGIADIASAWFISVRPDGSSSGNKNFLNDSEILGDKVAGDGIFSSGFSAPPNAIESGTWHFDFQAMDRRQNLSNVVRHSIKIKNE